MEFAGFDWDVGNRTKCKKHGLSIAEIESLFNRTIIILPDKENPQGERRFRAIGTTEKGRTRIRCVHAAGARRGILIRPISARYMHKKEVENYEKTYPDV